MVGAIRYNMEWLRAEGFAVASEELFMIAGVLDDRPQRGREIPYLMVSCRYQRPSALERVIIQCGPIIAQRDRLNWIACAGCQPQVTLNSRPDVP